MNLNYRIFKCFINFLIFSFLGISIVSAQNIKVKVDKPDNLFSTPSPHLDEDQYKTFVRNDTERLDSISERKDAVKRIYSEKMLFENYDSLLQNDLIRAPETAEINYVSQEDFIEALHKKFDKTTRSPNLNKDEFSNLDSKEIQPEFSQKTQNEITDFSDLLLTPNDLINLPLPNYTLIEKVGGNKLDSLRTLNLKDQKLKLKESKVSENIKTVNISKVPKFKKRIYLEMILGIQREIDEKPSINISPAMGYRFTPNLSLGLGPIISLNQKDFKSMIGNLRSFGKYEILEHRAYLQLENIYNSRVEETQAITGRQRFNLLVGGGAILPISRSFALNFSILYDITATSNKNIAPIIIRLGLSSFNKP